MHPTRISKHPLWRVLMAFPALISLLSAIILMPGVVSAAPKVSRPALPAQGGTLTSYRSGGSNNVTYHNGSVIHNPKAYLVFEGTNWAASDMQAIKQYFTDVSGSPFESILTQYYDSTGSISNTITIAGSVVDPTIYHSDSCGPKTIIDAGTPPISPVPEDIWNEITGVPFDDSTIVFVFTPPGYSVYGPADSCSSKPECGYHNNFPLGAIYAVIPWGGGGCANDPAFPSNATALDKTINTTSHEQFEAITNPIWTLFNFNGGGWYNSTDCGSGNACEIGDLCGYNHPGVFLNGDFYTGMQGEFSKTPLDGSSTTPGDCEYIAPPPVVNVVGGGAFNTVWEATGGITGPLGAPTDSWYSITGGQEEDFQGGSIYWSPATNTYEVQGAIHNEYVNTMGGPTGALNFPTSDEQNAYDGNGNVIGRQSAFRGTGCTANNQGSIILWSSSTGAHAVIGCIYQAYLALGGTISFLGLPTSDEQTVSSGHVSYFQGTSCGSGGGGGGIFDGPASGVHAVHGCIYQEYMAVQGGAGGVLSFPTTDELPFNNSAGIAIGRVSYFYGNLCGSRGPNNSGSAIYYSSATGAHQVGGCIYNKYWNMGGPNSQLGFPTSDVTVISGGYVSYFYGVRCGGVANGPANSGSAIYASSAGNYEVQGCVYATYQRLGGPAGLLGFPVSDENTMHDSSGNTMGWVSYFAGTSCGTTNTSGSAVYVPASNNNASGGHEVHGCIFAAYQNLGGPAGMGFPTSDEVPIHNSAGTVIGSVSYFSGHLCNSAGQSGSGSAIYHSGPETHEVRGCIYYKYWHDLGGPWGCLGFPTSDEYTNSAGNRESDFQHGTIIWNSTGATSTCS